MMVHGISFWYMFLLLFSLDFLLSSLYDETYHESNSFLS